MQRVEFFVYHLGYVVATSAMRGPDSQLSFPTPVYYGRHIKDKTVDASARKYVHGLMPRQTGPTAPEGTGVFSDCHWFPLGIKGASYTGRDYNASQHTYRWLAGVRLYADQLELCYLNGGERGTACIPIPDNGAMSLIISSDCSFAMALDMLLREGYCILEAIGYLQFHVMIPDDSFFTMDHLTDRTRLRVDQPLPPKAAETQPPVTEEKFDEPVQPIPDEPLHRKRPGKARGVE